MLGKNYENWMDWGNNPRKRRDRLYIMAEILDVAKEGVLKTQIMYRANLSFAQLNDYLSLLVELKLLETITNDKKTTYKTTKKGSKFLDNYKEIVLLLKKNNEDCVHKRGSSASW
jgi:predicted transcriptional regulator